MARESIRDLVARYNANADAGRFAQVLELFTEDATLEVATFDGAVRQYNGRGEIATLFTGTKHRWDTGAAAASSHRHHVRHFVSTHQIDVEDRAHAGGRSYFAVLMPHGLDHWGRYLDQYEEHGGRWLFARRRALPDGRAEHAGG